MSAPLSLLLFVSILSCSTPGSVVVEDAEPCHVELTALDGMFCAHTETDATQVLSQDEMLDFLQPQLDRMCVAVPGLPVCADNQTIGAVAKIPARAGAVCETDEQFKAALSTLEVACRLLGKQCTAEIQAEIAKLHAAYDRLKAVKR